MADQFGAAINIEVPKGLFDSKKFKAGLEELVMDTAKEARDFWEAEAGRVLNTSREDYQRAIGMIQTGKYEVTVQLMGNTPNGVGSDLALKIEKGAPSFSMRRGFMKSKSIKRKRIPRAIAQHMTKMTGQPPATRWMVIPINYTGRVGGPLKFRMFTNTQPDSMWKHPGFPGVHIVDTVYKEVEDHIFPKLLEKMIDEAI